MKNILGYIGVGLRELFWVAIAGAIIFGGITGFKYLSENREVVEAEAVPRPITLVETIDLQAFNAPLPIRGEGFIQPFRIASLASQVGGQVIKLHPGITERGVFKQGDVLVRLDDSAERASLTQTAANIEGLQAKLDLNAILLKRTEALRVSGTTSQAALDQVRGQRAELAASLNSLQAAKKSAKIYIDRKIVKAPFDGAVLSKSVEIGSVVNGGQSIAEIFTQDRMEINVPVREADAALIPGLFSGAAPTATITVEFAGKTFVWTGRVSRVAPNLDVRTRTLTVTVELDDVAATGAQGGETLASGAPPAMINSFAKVVIQGIRPNSTYPIPSTAMRGGKNLWLFDPSNINGSVLRIIKAELMHVDGETSYVRVKKLPEKSRLVTTALSTAQDGMRLRDVRNKLVNTITTLEQLTNE
ncbi:MAG: efflux RND transporter periplasmic adaptor subunit [Planktomarina sp.]|nr:efflux RND transporter periplasmic adaptor subunit [Planktomarina sp.]